MLELMIETGGRRLGIMGARASGGTFASGVRAF